MGRLRTSTFPITLSSLHAPVHRLEGQPRRYLMKHTSVLLTTMLLVNCSGSSFEDGSDPPSNPMSMSPIIDIDNINSPSVQEDPGSAGSGNISMDGGTVTVGGGLMDGSVSMDGSMVLRNLVPPELESMEGPPFFGEYSTSCSDTESIDASSSIHVSIHVSDPPDTWRYYQNLELCYVSVTDTLCYEGLSRFEYPRCKDQREGKSGFDCSFTIRNMNISVIKKYGFELQLQNYDMTTIYSVKFKPFSQNCVITMQSPEIPIQNRLIVGFDN